MQKKHKASSFFLAPKSSVNPKLGCCGCSYTIQNNNYKDGNGEMVYGLILLVDNIALLESKTSKEARLTKTA